VHYTKMAKYDKTHVPITLDLQDSNYAKWRDLFLVTLGCYGLPSHVIGTTDATPSDTLPTSDWACDDYIVLSWIYGSISTKLFGTIMAPWVNGAANLGAIADLFHDNKKSHALALDAEFRNMPQGDMCVHDNCAKLKSLADALSDAAQPITDEILVLTVLHGLNEQFSHLRSFLPFQVPFPTFLQTRSALVLEETQNKTDAKNASASTLWPSGNSILLHAGGERAPSDGHGGGSGSTDPHPPTPYHHGPYTNHGRGSGNGDRRG
jgi:hypothetical protein